MDWSELVAGSCIAAKFVGVAFPPSAAAQNMEPVNDKMPPEHKPLPTQNDSRFREPLGNQAGLISEALAFDFDVSDFDFLVVLA